MPVHTMTHVKRRPSRPAFPVVAAMILAVSCLSSDNADSGAPTAREKLLFEETFDDTNWAARGWYDGPRMEVEEIDGNPACVWRWLGKGDISPAGGAARLLIPPVESAILSFRIRHSGNWTWTGVPWHPHEFHFLTTADNATVGPAYTHLTFYFEAVNGVPRIAIQDSRNIDESRVGENLVGVTENRSVAGGNGDSDGHGDGDCYRAGNVHRNGKFWEADRVYFGDDPGPYYKGDWHTVKARVKLNSIRDGIGQRDGELQYWYDGKLIIDHRDVVFRTGKHPDMRINQFMMGPYYGPGVPHPQTIWFDDLRIMTDME